MGRSRSRSPARKERRRSRSKERERERERDRHRRHRSRSRSPRATNRRSRSRSPHRPSSPSYCRSESPDNDDVVFLGTTHEPVATNRAPGKRAKNQQNKGAAGPLDDADGDDEEADMMKLMGFADFNSTKGKHVPGNDVYVANIVQKRKYRQYMNRRGGFNRPLDFVA